MSDENILDPIAIENLRSLGDEEGDDSFLHEVIEIFIGDTPVRLRELRDSFQAADQATFIRAAHSIKGSSSNVGAKPLCKLARELETDSRITLEGLGDRVDGLEEAFETVKTALLAL